MKKTRLLCESNLTPIQQPNPRWKDDGKGTTPDVAGHARYVRNGDCFALMQSLGYEPANMIYDGTLNRAPTWAGRTADDLAAKGLDWTKESGAPGPGGKPVPSYCQPPDPGAVAACALLSKTPTLYGGIADLYCPNIFDLESPGNSVTPAETPQQRVAKLQLMIDAVNAAKAACHDSEVWWYGQFPNAVNCPLAGNVTDPAVTAKTLEFCRATTAACADAYYWDLDAASPRRFFAELSAADAAIRRWVPEYDKHKLIVLNPFVQVYFPNSYPNEPAALNNTPMPIGVWRDAVDFCVERDFWLFVWTGVALVDGVTEHLRYAARYAR